MGARPIALLDSLRFGELTDARTRYLFQKLWRGLAVMEIVLVFQPLAAKLLLSHVIRNPLVNAMCVGLIRHDEIQKAKQRRRK